MIHGAWNTTMDCTWLTLALNKIECSYFINTLYIYCKLIQ
jgi:hypothetical protein